jgi:hypothetical protein
MKTRLPFFAPLLGLTLLGLMYDAWAQNAQPIGGIYTCTDANGRKLRSDRPIAACADREQRVLNPSGTERNRIGPALTEQQKAEQEAQRRAEAAAQAQAMEEKRRDRALLMRYPARAVHDEERAQAVAKVKTVIQTASQRIDELREERKKIDRELEFYKGDPNKAPPALRRQIDFVVEGIESQQRFIGHRHAEIDRINARFDEELTRLQGLWRDQAPAAQAREAKP